MARFRLSGLAMSSALTLLGPGAAPAEDTRQFTRDFELDRCSWVSASRQNHLFPLNPGFRLVLVGEEEGDGGTEQVELHVTTLSERQRIVFMTPGGRRVSLLARVVEEREWVDGELNEVARNFFALCRETGDVFYFGEAVDNYEDGEIADHQGSWQAGKRGAQPGLQMAGRFLLGSRYYQEVAPGVAEDRGENVAMSLTEHTDAGTFHGCVVVLDTNALHPDEEGEEKTYCPGVGLTRDVDLELVEAGYVDAGD